MMKNWVTSCFLIVIAVWVGFIFYLGARQLNPITMADTHNEIYMHIISTECGVEANDALWTTAMHKISDCIERLKAGIAYDPSIKMDYNNTPDFKIYVDTKLSYRVIIGSNPSIDFVDINCLYNNPFSKTSIPYFCDNGAIKKIQHGRSSNEWVIFKPHSKWSLHNGTTIEDIWLKPLEINQ